MPTGMSPHGECVARDVTASCRAARRGSSSPRWSSPCEASIAAWSRFSGGVRIRPQNTGVIAGPATDKLPVHPLAGARAGCADRPARACGAVLAGEIAHDRVRFPQRKPSSSSRVGTSAVRVHRQIGAAPCSCRTCRRYRCARAQAHLADRPHHLLHVGRGVAPPDFQHCVSSAALLSSSCPACAGIHVLIAHTTDVDGRDKPGHDAGALTSAHQSSRRASSGSMIGMPSRIG